MEWVLKELSPIHSPRIDRIEVVRRGKVRRAKLLLHETTNWKSS